MKNEILYIQGSEKDTVDVNAPQEGDDQFNIDQAKDYALREISRLRQKAVRASVEHCGYLILHRIIEEIYCASHPVFDHSETLTDQARAVALDSIHALLNYGVLLDLLDRWITPDVYYQICEDEKEAFELEKAYRCEREPALITCALLSPTIRHL
jgi:hypothetical protein